jgi:uncharacterized protein (DUF433 family)
MMTIPRELHSVLVSTPETLGGCVRFTGTGVPVKALLDSITAGKSIEYFLENHPSVTREQVFAVMKWQQNQTREAFGLELVH